MAEPERSETGTRLRAERRGAERREAERWGRRAETLAALWLRLRGYRILARRHRGPLGEIDLIARRGPVLVAVEVKARADLDLGFASVSPRQRQRIARTLRHYQARTPSLGALDLRVDLVIMRPWRLPVVIPDVWHPDG